ncbi:MAG: hypothetical protein OEY94_07695 [Alphaproteobacteria bacterium]|nr:hypothetical protein [Alphaproteobacteria bacterium]
MSKNTLIIISTLIFVLTIVSYLRFEDHKKQKLDICSLESASDYAEKMVYSRNPETQKSIADLKNLATKNKIQPSELKKYLLIAFQYYHLMQNNCKIPEDIEYQYSKAFPGLFYKSEKLCDKKAFLDEANKEIGAMDIITYVAVKDAIYKQFINSSESLNDRHIKIIDNPKFKKELVLAFGMTGHRFDNKCQNPELPVIELLSETLKNSVGQQD